MQKHNCVSEQVSQQMARGVGELFTSDIGIGITGYAAPLPEKGITRLFAFYALYKHGKLLECTELKTREHEFVSVQQDYVAQVISRAVQSLTR